jgi:hypothetical protein
VHVGERVRIFVRVTPPPSGAPISRVQVDAIGDGRSGWVVTGDAGATAAIWATPQIAGRFEWQASVMSAEGCTAATGAPRRFEVVP